MGKFVSREIIKKADISEHQTVAPDDDMLPEYHFDYRQARPSRFATDIVEGRLVVVLEQTSDNPDVRSPGEKGESNA